MERQNYETAKIKEELARKPELERAIENFEAFLADTLEKAEKFWQILQREGVTTPDLPEWYR